MFKIISEVKALAISTNHLVENLMEIHFKK